MCHNKITIKKHIGAPLVEKTKKTIDIDISSHCFLSSALSVWWQILRCYYFLKFWEIRGQTGGEEEANEGSREEMRRSEGAHGQLEVEQEKGEELKGGRGDCSSSVSCSSLFCPLDVPVHHTAALQQIQKQKKLHCTQSAGQYKRNIHVQTLSLPVKNNAVLYPWSFHCHWWPGLLSLSGFGKGMAQNFNTLTCFFQILRWEDRYQFHVTVLSMVLELGCGYLSLSMFKGIKNTPSNFRTHLIIGCITFF